MSKPLKTILIVFAVFFLLCLCTSVGGYFLVKAGTIKLPDNPIFDFISDPKDSLSEEAGEELAEDLIEGSTGEDVDIEIDDDSISYETEDGGYYAGSTDKWPSDIPNTFPEYDSGNVNYASKIVSDSTSSWSVILDSVSSSSLEDYKDELESSGFTIQSESTYNDAKSISAIKDSYSVFLTLDESTDDLTITMYLEQ